MELGREECLGHAHHHGPSGGGSGSASTGAVVHRPVWRTGALGDGRRGIDGWSPSKGRSMTTGRGTGLGCFGGGRGGGLTTVHRVRQPSVKTCSHTRRRPASTYQTPPAQPCNWQIDRRTSAVRTCRGSIDFEGHPAQANPRFHSTAARVHH